jgi:hypothetical protein
MPLTKVKSGGVSDSITLTSPDINAPDIDGGTIDNAVIGGSTAAAGSFTTITATGGSSSNWNTAYGWGDHSTQSYATQTYVGTEVSNLVDSSPAALNTLNELAAALGDDPNFATTVTNSIALKAPLASPSFTGNVGIAANNSGQGAVLTLENTDTSITTNDVVGQIDFYANDSSTGGTGQKATIQAIAQNGSGTSVGLIFGTSSFPNTTATEHMRIDASGNVGIGKIPETVLDLQATDNLALRFYNSTSFKAGIQVPTTAGDMIAGSAVNDLAIRSQTNMLFATGGNAERMRIGGASGYVGIGCSPTHGLTVSDIAGGGTDANMRRITIKSETHGVNSGFRFDSESANGTAVSSGYYFQPGNSDATTYLGLSANDISYQMVVTREGNVGIANSAPSVELALGSGGGEKLHVYHGGSVKAGFGVDLSGASRELSMFHSTSGTNGNISFGKRLESNGAYTEAVRIDGAGNVGIGENNPKAPGGSGARSLTLKGTSYPQLITVATAATANSTTWRSISRSTHVYQIQTVNDAVTAEQTAYEISRGAGSLSISYQRWFAGTTEAMRIDGSGNLTVGDSSTANTSNSACTISAGGAITTSRAATNNQTHHSFMNPNGVVGTIKTIASQTSFNTSSDQRLKENIADADDAGSKIDAIQVRQYDWKVDGSHQDYGMIAQELQAVAPEAVSGDADSEEMMGVDYSKLVPMLVKEIQSLRNRVAQLEA